MRYKVPFARQDDYISLYSQTTDSEKAYYFRFIRMSHPC